MIVYREEIWKPVVGWPGYEISTAGNVRGLRGAVRTFPDPDGYLRFNVSASRAKRAQLSVAREVLRAHVREPRPGECACHFPDADKRNCRVENLMWGTHKENERHKIHHGTKQAGGQHYKAKLTPADVEEIRASDEPGIVLAARKGVSPSAVSSIRRGRSWKGAANAHL